MNTIGTLPASLPLGSLSQGNTSSSRAPTARISESGHTARNIGSGSIMNTPGYSNSNNNNNNSSDYELSPMDALRFVAILEEGKERLELIGMLLQDTSKRREAVEATNTHRDDIVNLMIHQRNLEQQFDVLMKQRTQLHGLSNKTKYIENEKAIQNMIYQLQQSQTNLTNQLGDQPSRLSGILKLQKDRQVILNAITSTIENLTNNNSFHSLIAYITARAQEDARLEKLRERELKNNQAINELQVRISSEEADLQHQIKEKNVIIERLTSELKQLRRISSSELKYQRNATEAALEAEKRVNVYAQHDLQQVVNVYSREIESDELCFKRASNFNERQRAVLDNVHEDWHKKSKADISSRDALIKNMRELRSNQKERLSALSESWEKIVEEKTQQVNLIKKRTIEVDAKKQLAEKMDSAQRIIRKTWFDYKERKEKARLEAKRKKRAEIRAARKNQPKRF